MEDILNHQLINSLILFSLRGQGHEQLGSGSHNHNANNANNNIPIGAGNAIIGKGEMSPYDDRFAASGVNQPTSESLRLASGPQMGNGPFTTTGAIINPNLQQPLSDSIGGSAHHTPINVNNNNNNNTGYMTSSHLTGLENFSSPRVPGSGTGAGLGVGAGRDLTHNSNIIVMVVVVVVEEDQQVPIILIILTNVIRYIPIQKLVPDNI